MSALLWLCFSISGAAALALEVLWMRAAELVLGATAPTAATVLACYFAGLGLGAAGARCVRWQPIPPIQSQQAQLESGVRGNVPAPFGAGKGSKALPIATHDDQCFAPAQDTGSPWGASLCSASPQPGRCSVAPHALQRQGEGGSRPAGTPQHAWRRGETHLALPERASGTSAPRATPRATKSAIARPIQSYRREATRCSCAGSVGIRSNTPLSTQCRMMSRRWNSGTSLASVTSRRTLSYLSKLITAWVWRAHIPPNLVVEVRRDRKPLR